MPRSELFRICSGVNQIEGFSDAELSRIHAPIGLDIGAVSPAEIAVSALAQVVERLRTRDEETTGA